MVMDKKKAVKLEQMEAEMARLWEQSQNETDNKKKQKLIQSRNKLQWKAAAMRSGRKLSKQTRDDLEALNITNAYLEVPYAENVSEINSILDTYHTSIMNREVTVEEGVASMNEQVGKILNQ